MDDLGQVLRDLNGKAITHRVYYRNNDDGRAYEAEVFANAATEGPWRKFQTAQTATTYVVGPRGFLAGGLITGETYERDNAEFIAHARYDVPWLIEQVRKRDAALRAALDLADRWAAQSTDYDEDTEQQIDDGKAIVRVIEEALS